MREFTCGTCEKKFTRKGNLLRHQRQKHPDDDESPRQYSCQFCSKTFRYEANLRKHQKLHTPTWTCGICGRSGFKNSAELFLDKIQDTDWQEFVRRQKPNSKWRVSLLCNVALHIYKVTEQPIGRGKRLPSFIVENRGLDALESNYNTGQVYEDSFCYFRCLARHKGYHLKNLEKKAKLLRAEYLNSLPENQRKNEDGVRLSDLYYLDKLFGVNTLVYTLEQCGPSQKPIATLLHRPAKVLSKA